MKKLLVAFVVAAAAVMFLAGSPGCSNTCEELQGVCDRCVDQDYLASCQATVDEGDSAVCSGRLGTYQQFCPDRGEGGGGGGAGPGCAPGEAFCDGACVEVLSNLGHCGSCAKACSAPDIYCVGGTCSSECPSPPFSDCDGACVDTATSPAHCGACGNTCGASEVCSEGLCVPECDTSDTSTAPSQCGQSCVNLASDPLHCGSCGNACGPSQICSNGSCANGCASGLTECCGKCIDLAADAGHCGGCDEGCDGLADAGESGPCGGNLVCDDGACVASCSPPDTQCGSGCLDTESAAAHCGACNNLCPPGTSCSNGQCTSGGCASGLTDCGGSCVDLTKNPQHCGICGHSCTGGQVCSLGSCSGGCAAGLTACSGGCIDLQSDPKNCGGCNVVCSGATPACQAGQCVAACSGQFTDCGSGQCVSTTGMATNILHCGGCNNNCADNNACTSDSCTAGQCNNVSGGVICNDGNPCTQDSCDPITKCKHEPYTQQDFVALCAQIEGMNPNDGCIWCDPYAEGSPCVQATPASDPNNPDPTSNICHASPPEQKTPTGCGVCSDPDGAGGMVPACIGTNQPCPTP